MKTLLYMVILCAVTVIPVRGTDVGKLIPVEVVAVSESGGTVTVNTDTGDRGAGATLAEAIQGLKDTASGVIYLDTAEYLLLEPGTENRESLLQYLKGNTRVYHAPEGIPLEGIADYLSVNRSKAKLGKLDEQTEIPMVTEEDGRYRIMSKNFVLGVDKK